MKGENKSRAGVPTSLAMHDMGLATVINPQNRDATGKPLTAAMKSTIEDSEHGIVEVKFMNQ